VETLAPRERVLEVPERMLADGSVCLPLEEGIEAVAMLFLHSYRSPQHEIRMCEMLSETNQHVFVSPSYELSRKYREYERPSTVVANAYVGPLVSCYLGDLEQRLQQADFRGDLMIMQSIGGYNEGLAIHIPTLDTVEVETGGGSIA
jgi:N-methylhydantoinase A